MPLTLFTKLIPTIRDTELIHLQGWGEPLLNPDIFEMIRICKDNSKRVGFTTNGMLLSEEIIRKLIDLKIDILGVSLAGTSAKTHNKFRQGTDFNFIISNLMKLSAIKGEIGSHVPALHLAYIMLESNFHEIKDIVLLAKGLGARQIILSNLSLILNPELSTEAIFNGAHPIDYYIESLKTTKAVADKEGIVLEFRGPILDDGSQHCPENVCNSCVINVLGEVLPCVFVNPLLSFHRNSGCNKHTTYYFKDESYDLDVFSFGNIQHDSFALIWQSPRYARFRDLFKYGDLVESGYFMSNLPDRCIKCYKRLLA
jgi:MoaA/NifB/PqqE/SkfB family radical SAM enzyme